MKVKEATMQTGWESVLFLEKGHLFEGLGFGAARTRGGEAVFNTGMSGYQEIFTDPSYLKQIVVMTYPHLGNYGVNGMDLESRSLYLSGVVARQYCNHPSNFRMTTPLHDYLAANGVPGIFDVDTRRITQLLRDEGAQRGVIFARTEIQSGESAEACGQRLLQEVEPMEGLELVSEVSCKTPYDFNPRGNRPLMVVYDYGAKTNILRSFVERGYDLHVVPYQYPHQEVAKLKPAAVVLSNGPGDPATVSGAVEQIQGVLGKTPIFAICMGHQLLARALGATTYKLKFGHHGINHPVEDRLLKRIIITSQNHGFAVKEEDLKMKDLQLTQVSLNDGSVEGFFSEKMKLLSVQFHPEAKPGPSEASLLFDYFIRGFLK